MVNRSSIDLPKLLPKPHPTASNHPHHHHHSSDNLIQSTALVPSQSDTPAPHLPSPALLHANFQTIPLQQVEAALKQSLLPNDPSRSIWQHLHTLHAHAPASQLAAAIELLPSLVARVEQTSLTAAYLWSWLQHRNLWNAHADPDLRSEQALATHLDRTTSGLLRPIFALGTHTYIFRQRNMSTIEREWGSDWWSSVPSSIRPVREPHLLSTRLLQNIAATARSPLTLADAVARWQSEIDTRLDPIQRASFQYSSSGKRQSYEPKLVLADVEAAIKKHNPEPQQPRLAQLASTPLPTVPEPEKSTEPEKSPEPDKSTAPATQFPTDPSRPRSPAPSSDSSASPSPSSSSPSYHSLSDSNHPVVPAVPAHATKPQKYRILKVGKHRIRRLATQQSSQPTSDSTLRTVTKPDTTNAKARRGNGKHRVVPPHGLDTLAAAASNISRSRARPQTSTSHPPPSTNTQPEPDSASSPAFSPARTGPASQQRSCSAPVVIKHLVAMLTKTIDEMQSLDRLDNCCSGCSSIISDSLSTMHADLELCSTKLRSMREHGIPPGQAPSPSPAPVARPSGNATPSSAPSAPSRKRRRLSTWFVPSSDDELDDHE